MPPRAAFIFGKVSCYQNADGRIFPDVDRCEHKNNAPGEIRGHISCLPCVSAVLTDAHRLMYCFGFVLSGAEDRNDQSRQREAKPPKGNPPPADEQPPEDAVMLALELRFGNCLYINVLALALGTNHNSVPPSFVILTLYSNYPGMTTL